MGNPSDKELKELVDRVVEKLREEPPWSGCIFSDAMPCDSCDVTTFYAVGEEDGSSFN